MAVIVDGGVWSSPGPVLSVTEGSEELGSDRGVIVSPGNTKTPDAISRDHRRGGESCTWRVDSGTC